MADVDSACRARSPSEWRKIRCAEGSEFQARVQKTPQRKRCARRIHGCRVWAPGELRGRHQAPWPETALVNTPATGAALRKLKVIVTTRHAKGPPECLWGSDFRKYARCLSCRQPGS